jgi:hypothetical protein
MIAKELPKSLSVILLWLSKNEELKRDFVKTYVIKSLDSCAEIFKPRRTPINT